MIKSSPLGLALAFEGIAVFPRNRNSLNSPMGAIEPSWGRQAVYLQAGEASIIQGKRRAAAW
jgi:hypothetical protein